MSTLGNNLLAQYYAQQGALPNEYRRVEYLESTGSQYIDSMVVYHGGSTMRVDIRMAPFSTYGACFGNTQDSSIKQNRLIWGTNNTSIIIYNNAYPSGDVLDSRMVVNNIGSDRRVTGWISTTDSYFNGQPFGVRGPWIHDGTQTDNSIILFGRRDNNIAYPAPSGTRIYRWAIDDVCNFIPCVRKSDNKPGMYDLCRSICPLTNTPFYINAGTGEFVTP